MKPDSAGPAAETSTSEIANSNFQSVIPVGHSALSKLAAHSLKQEPQVGGCEERGRDPSARHKLLYRSRCLHRQEKEDMLTFLEFHERSSSLPRTGVQTVTDDTRRSHAVDYDFDMHSAPKSLNGFDCIAHTTFPRRPRFQVDLNHPYHSSSHSLTPLACFDSKCQERQPQLNGKQGRAGLVFSSHA
uniref:Uncharacterized protein n=1 Tax=Chromera velia CCMP2878 TaxID=1169474 RepID=A0A0G4EZR0_9ALVE|eukprot:Cvel_14257.t1-p1 / transcript=Cvel_14257.t1 / gene=Cvel_14257 / organism=Chromera_velia_CCMP2878 / gene_product=hypothetical protein / transcript_product=hypothetical protein / location=Cvel_scaffold1006:48845-53933(-) / protein_length=186 / sequence_SO=supercontig / SO=protein_coding / is_pseudo=false